MFCKIVRGELPSYEIWADDKHIAVLDINPEVTGQVWIAPKKHYPSYIINVDNAVIFDLVAAAKKVAVILDSRLNNVLRTKFVFEGLDVDHLHIKLYPMYKGYNEEKLGLPEVFETLTK